ncbi:fusaric acid resistance protein [Arthrobacter alpinus]|uniref:Fusaric acid resistance protein n=1 Tax=Arthrobacter alpinus TaxID=656366 RepID=A0A0M5M0D4_9MICC|nr:MULTISPECIES: FUSC family protein [Arthrobacter]ALE93532.1 fusaric acid resistance protein [Arthrobacter alpinus]
MPESVRDVASVRFLKRRARLGLRRSYNSLVPALLITLCSVGAYYFSMLVLGHQGPLFAATSAIIALGFSRDPRLRRVLEVGLGCTIGIALGDTLLHWLGAGIWQAALVVFLSVLLARFLDSGAIFTTQLALQSLLVVLLPIPAGGPFTRSIDAIVGGCFALAVTLLVPRDPRRAPKDDVKLMLGELALVLRECASALSYNDSTTAWHALVRARSQQPRIDAMRQGLHGSVEIATLSPLYRRHLQEVEALAKVMERLDYAMRSSRVLARRLTSVINNAALSDVGTLNLAEAISECASAVEELGAAVADTNPRTTLSHARDSLADIAIRLHPSKLEITRMEGEALVLLFRTLMVDLLEVASMDPADARALLPKL